MAIKGSFNFDIIVKILQSILKQNVINDEFEIFVNGEKKIININIKKEHSISNIENFLLSLIKL